MGSVIGYWPKNEMSTAPLGCKLGEGAKEENKAWIREGSLTE